MKLDIFLRDFLDAGSLFALDAANRLISVEPGPSLPPRAGYAQMRKAGIVSRKPTAIAFFVRNGEAVLLVGEVEFAVHNSNMTRRSRFPFTRSFRAKTESGDKVGLDYVYFGNESWPHTDDLLEYAVQTTRHRVGLRRFELVWSANQRGVDTSKGDFAEEIERRLASEGLSEGSQAF